MVKEAKLTIPLNLEMNRDSYQKLSASKGLQGNETMTGITLGLICNQLLDCYANGGLVLKGESVKQIEDACQEKVSTELQLVSAVQKLKGKNDFSIDDALMPALRTCAEAVGMSEREFIDEVIHRNARNNLAFYVQGMSYEPVVYITEDQGRRLEKLTGKKRLTGEDILALTEKKELVGA